MTSKLKGKQYFNILVSAFSQSSMPITTDINFLWLYISHSPGRPTSQHHVLVTITTTTRCCRYKWNISFHAHIHKAIECRKNVLIFSSRFFILNNKKMERKWWRQKKKKTDERTSAQQWKWRWWRKRWRCSRSRNFEDVNNLWISKSVLQTPNDTLLWTWIDTYLKIIRISGYARRNESI